MDEAEFRYRDLTSAASRPEKAACEKAPMPLEQYPGIDAAAACNSPVAAAAFKFVPTGMEMVGRAG